MEGATTNRRCPYCGRMVIYKPLNRSKLYNGIMAFGSVHTECPHCKRHVACGALTEGKVLIATEEKYKELMKSAEERKVEVIVS